jgi:hypothetical protein
MLLGFKKQFVPMILSRLKTHTIRAKRKHPPRVGEICHCYTGLRQKGARLLGRWPCVKVQQIDIGPVRHGQQYADVWIDGLPLQQDELQALARRDGFGNFAQMMQFWEGRLPFEGYMIHWDPTKIISTRSRNRLRAEKPEFKPKKGNL